MAFANNPPCGNTCSNGCWGFEAANTTIVWASWWLLQKEGRRNGGEHWEERHRRWKEMGEIGTERCVARSHEERDNVQNEAVVQGPRREDVVLYVSATGGSFGQSIGRKHLHYYF